MASTTPARESEQMSETHLVTWSNVVYPAQGRLSKQSPEGDVVLGVTPQVSTHMIQLLPPVT